MITSSRTKLKSNYNNDNIDTISFLLSSSPSVRSTCSLSLSLCIRIGIPAFLPPPHHQNERINFTSDKVVKRGFNPHQRIDRSSDRRTNAQANEDNMSTPRECVRAYDPKKYHFQDERTLCFDRFAFAHTHTDTY